MQHFYDAQIRRYLTQTIRVFSNFVVKYGDGTLVRIPVTYGDMDKQVANIIKQNSENAINACPRIAVYVADLDLDRDRLSDATHVGKMHFRERGVDITSDSYTTGQGRNYTVERIMPTPFKLTMKVDLWSANTDQKLQILEQILVLFNPALELQTTDNYIDWTSLTVLNLDRVMWSSRQVPIGSQDVPIDIATLTLTTPIWISPPVKVKHLGVVTKIITSLYDHAYAADEGYIDGLGQPLTSSSGYDMVGKLATEYTTVTDYNIQVYGGQAIVLGKSESSIPREPTLEIPVRQGTPISWKEVFDQYPGQYVAGSSTLFLLQSNGTEVVGTIAINPVDPTLLTVSWDKDTLNTNTGIDSQGRFDWDPNYDTNSYRDKSPGTFDAIIDPLKVGPNHGITNLNVGDRFLIIEDIGDVNNQEGAIAWKNTDLSDLVAHANDIIEWTGDTWTVIFDSQNEPDVIIYQTNLFTGVQYMWNGVTWVKSFEGVYKKGFWRIEL